MQHLLTCTWTLTVLACCANSVSSATADSLTNFQCTTYCEVREPETLRVDSSLYFVYNVLGLDGLTRRQPPEGLTPPQQSRFVTPSLPYGLQVPADSVTAFGDTVLEVVLSFTDEPCLWHCRLELLGDTLVVTRSTQALSCMKIPGDTYVVHGRLFGFAGRASWLNRHAASGTTDPIRSAGLSARDPASAKCPPCTEPSQRTVSGKVSPVTREGSRDQGMWGIREVSYTITTIPHERLSPLANPGVRGLQQTRDGPGSVVRFSIVALNQVANVRVEFGGTTRLLLVPIMCCSPSDSRAWKSSVEVSFADLNIAGFDVQVGGRLH